MAIKKTSPGIINTQQKQTTTTTTSPPFRLGCSGAVGLASFHIVRSSTALFKQLIYLLTQPSSAKAGDGLGNLCIGANEPSCHQLLFSLLFSIDNYTTPNFCPQCHNILPLHLGDSRDTSPLTITLTCTCTHTQSLTLTLNLLHPHSISHTHTCAHSRNAHSSRE